MGDYVFPTAKGKYDGSSNANQTQFLRTGHTAAVPKVVLFKRQSLNSAGAHSVTVRMVEAVPTSVEVVAGRPRNNLITLEIRNVTGQVDADIKTALTELSTMLADADFQDDVVTENRIPTSAG
jgi:hypothetical protein